MYNLSLKKSVEKKLKKISKKDKELFKSISKKVKQIQATPYHFKPLHKPMQNKRRANVGSFVLIYEINEQFKTITLMDIEHHDNVYK